MFSVTSHELLFFFFFFLYGYEYKMYEYNNNCVIFAQLLLVLLFVMGFIAEVSFVIPCSRMSEYIGRLRDLGVMHSK